MMKHYLALLLFFWVACAAVLAQDQARDYYPRPELRFSPLSLLPFPYSNFQWGWEQPFRHHPRQSFDVHLGFMNPFPYHEPPFSDVRKMWGGVLRLGYRYYLNEREWDYGQYFVSAQFFSQYESWAVSDWVDRNGGAYEELLEYDKKVQSNGLLMILGWKYAWPASRIGVEFTAGMGAKLRKISFSGLGQDDGDTGNDGIFLFGEQFAPASVEDSGLSSRRAYFLGFQLTYAF